LQQKRCYSVEAEREARGRRRAEKERTKGQEKMALWGKWAKQRSQIAMMMRS
jgi:hypothetical protein